MTFIDYEKAFDSVETSVVMDAPEKSGRGNICRGIRRYL